MIPAPSERNFFNKSHLKYLRKIFVELKSDAHEVPSWLHGWAPFDKNFSEVF